MKTSLILKHLDKVKFSFKGKKILIADRGRIESVMKNYCAIKILSKQMNIDPIILTQGSFDNELNKVYKKLGFKKFLKTFDLKNQTCRTIYFLLKSMINLLKVLKFFYSKNFYAFIYTFKVSDVNVGDIVYDRYIRDGKKYLKPSFFDFSFLKYFFVTVYKVFFLENYLKSNAIKLVIVNTHSYTNNYSIVFKLAKKLKIDILYLKDFQISFFKNGQYSNENDPRIISKKKLDKINFSKIKRKKFLLHMQKRVRGKLSHFDVKNAFGKKTKLVKNLIKNKRIDLSNFRKKILIAAHSLSDANHFYFNFNVKSFFYDYHSQLIKTLNFAKKHKDILFLLRPHPSSKFWNEIGVIDKIYKIYKSPNIILTNNRYDTNDLLKFVDTTITVHGTIGIETAGFYKKKPILAGTGLYSNLGFTFDAKKEDEYYKNILVDKDKHKLNLSETKLAEKALYYYELLSKETYKSYVSREKILLSDHKYIKDLNNFLKKNDIKNDEYFKNLKNKLILNNILK